MHGIIHEPSSLPPAAGSSRQILLAGGTTLLLGLVACGGGGSGSSSAPPPPVAFQVTQLVSDQPIAGATTDTHLVNPWGLAYGPATDFWVANQGTATTTVYDGLGQMPTVPIVVSNPALPGHVMGGPTGVVFNGSARFLGDEFLLASLDGCICGWSSGTVTTRRVDQSGTQAVYTGLAVGTTGTTATLFAANFTGGTVDTFDASYAPVSLGASALVDPTLPAGFSPFNVQVLGGKLYVTYAKRVAPALRETSGAGFGYVSVFNLDGSFIQRLASGGPLNSPWGLALAPASFGPFAGALLVGNFGDGHITAYNVTTGTQMGQLTGANGAPLAIDGLWAITFGNDTSAGKSTQLYFTAGPSAETHGLFGTVSYGSPGGTGGPTGGGLGY